MNEQVQNLAVNVAGNEQGIPRVDALFGRVTVILGANGAGKTKLLQHILLNKVLGQEKKYVRVEGTRGGSIPGQINMSHSPEEVVTREYRNRLHEPHATRLNYAVE